MYRMFFGFLKCTIQGGPKVDVLLSAFLYLWMKFWESIDKYRIVPVRKLFYFHHWSTSIARYLWRFANLNSANRLHWHGKAALLDEKEIDQLLARPTSLAEQNCTKWTNHSMPEVMRRLSKNASVWLNVWNK